MSFSGRRAFVLAAAEFLDNSSLTSFASELAEEGRSDLNKLMTDVSMLKRAQRRIRQKHAIPTYLEKDESFMRIRKLDHG